MTTIKAITGESAKHHIIMIMKEADYYDLLQYAIDAKLSIVFNDITAAILIPDNIINRCNITSYDKAIEKINEILV